MELILKSNNKESIAKIIELAKKLNVVVEKKDDGLYKQSREKLKAQILNFKAAGDSSFGDAATWEREQRDGRELPFSWRWPI